MGIYDKNGKKVTTLHELHELWKSNEFVFNTLQNEILNAKAGEKIGNRFHQFTICTNAKKICEHTVKIVFSGYNSEDGYKDHYVRICSLGHESMEACNP